MTTPINDISEEAISVILYGSNEIFTVDGEFTPGSVRQQPLELRGIASFIAAQIDDETSTGRLKNGHKDFMTYVDCPECHGSRLKKEALKL
jgi:excinuclease ABC subunit A